MRRITLATLLVITGCNAGPVVSERTPQASTTTSLVTTTTQVTETTSTQSNLSGGQFVRLDPLTLEPLRGFDPIPYPSDSWNVLSGDGSLAVNLEWDRETERIATARLIDLEDWRRLGELDVNGYTAGVFHDGLLYTLDHNGALAASDLTTGELDEVATWPANRWAFDDLHVITGGRIAALMTAGTGSGDSVLVYDPATGTTTDVPVGAAIRTNPDSGVFDGDYQIPETDLPGVAWLDDRVLLVYAEEMEIVEVDLNDGTVRSRTIDMTTWWGRLIDNWFPTAVAKGPTLGVHSSAALSADGRHLFISGNRTTIEVADNGHLVETNEHLGLTVVDLATWSTVDAPDLDLQFVRYDGGMVQGINTISQVPWAEELYVMDIDPEGTVTALGPFTVHGGGCQLTEDVEHLVCTEHSGNSTLLRVVSIHSGETIAERAVSSADYFHPNGVLEDWAPISG